MSKSYLHLKRLPLVGVLILHCDTDIVLLILTYFLTGLLVKRDSIPLNSKLRLFLVILYMAFSIHAMKVTSSCLCVFS